MVRLVAQYDLQQYVLVVCRGQWLAGVVAVGGPRGEVRFAIVAPDLRKRRPCSHRACPSIALDATSRVTSKSYSICGSQQ
jgi:hypothetical protein